MFVVTHWSTFSMTVLESLSDNSNIPIILVFTFIDFPSSFSLRSSRFLVWQWFLLKPGHCGYDAMRVLVLFKPFVSDDFLWHCSGKQRTGVDPALFVQHRGEVQVCHWACIDTKGDTLLLLVRGGTSVSAWASTDSPGLKERNASLVFPRWPSLTPGRDRSPGSLLHLWQLPRVRRVLRVLLVRAWRACKLGSPHGLCYCGKGWNHQVFLFCLARAQ